MPKYSLGSSDAEVARLEAQAQFIEAPSRMLLKASGIEAGMRVLDLGTGLGHIAAAAADLVGSTGEVVGLDIDPHMLELAAKRTVDYPQVRLAQGDVTSWRDPDPFDVVVGRLILFHMADPVAVVRHHAAAVRPGGRVVMLDYDVGGVRAEPPEPFIKQMNDLLLAAFRAAGADPTVGSKLQSILGDAGVEVVGGFAIPQYLPPESPIGPMMLTGVLGSLAQVITAHGLATEEELGLDTLPERAGNALRANGSYFVPPHLAGAWGVRV